MKISKKLIKNLIYGAVIFIIYNILLNLIIFPVLYQKNIFSIFNFNEPLIPLPFFDFVTYFLVFSVKIATLIIYRAFAIMGEQYTPEIIWWLVSFFGIVIWGAILGLIWFLLTELSAFSIKRGYSFIRLAGYYMGYILKGLLVGYLLNSIVIISLAVIMSLGTSSCRGEPDCGFGLVVLMGYIYYPMLVIVSLIGGYVGFFYGKKAIKQKIGIDEQVEYYSLNIKKLLLVLLIFVLIITIFFFGVYFFKKYEAKNRLKTYGHAINENNMSLCLELYDSSATKEENNADISRCYYDVAKFNKNLDACDYYLYADGPGGCYAAVARYYNDRTICNLAKEEKFKNECFESFRIDDIIDLAAKENDISLCKQFKNDDLNSYNCYVKIAVKNKNLDACGYLTDILHSEEGCYFAVAVEYKDSTICELIKKDEFFKNKCDRETQ
ncbi:MAG: hypothetical protein AAB352_02870 [Patescibacteria group bacterium]